MKYAITGHTQGIGKGIYDRLWPNVIGFSKSTGYDINNKKDRENIIKQSMDCDVFINNACENFGQTYLLIDLFKAWNFTDKTIINVGSKIAEVILPEEKYYLLEYQAQKLILKEMSSKLQTDKLKIKYKWFGYVGTDNIKKKYPLMTSDKFITIDQAVNIILS
jgi:hypothetical protein